MKQLLSFSKLPTAAIFAGILFLTSCKKDNNTSAINNPGPQLSVEAAQNDAIAEQQFNDVFNISMAVQSSDAGAEIGLGTGTNILYRATDADRIASPVSAHCYTVTVDPKGADNFPKTVTVDFGSGCTGIDGKVRSGKIITVFSGPMMTAGSTASTTFEDYKVDSFMVDGTFAIQNTSTSNKMAWTVTITDGKITNTNSGKWIKRDAVHEHTQIEGNGTPFNPLDDVYEITGHATGSNSSGNSWSTDITQPLMRKFVCQWREKGKITLSLKSNSIIAVLDYGDGSCDDEATITISGITKTINL